MPVVADEGVNSKYKLLVAMETDSPGEFPNNGSDYDDDSQHGLVIDESYDNPDAQQDTPLDHNATNPHTPPNAVVKNGQPEIIHFSHSPEAAYPEPQVVSPNRHDRMRLRPWLFAQIDSGNYPGLAWLNQEKTLFRIPWMHRSKREWKFQHSSIFVEWAKHTGKFRPGIDTPDFVHMKTRLRCAFNKAPDIEEVAGIQKVKHDIPHKIYRLHPPGSNKFANMPPKAESERTVHQRNRKRRKMAEKTKDLAELDTTSPADQLSPMQDLPKNDINMIPMSPTKSPTAPPLVENHSVGETNKSDESNWTNQTVIQNHVIIEPDSGLLAKSANSTTEALTPAHSGIVVPVTGSVAPVTGNVVPASPTSSNVIYIYQNGMVMAAMPQESRPTVPNTPEALPAFEQLLSSDIPGSPSEQELKSGKKIFSKRRKSSKPAKEMLVSISPVVVEPNETIISNTQEMQAMKDNDCTLKTDNVQGMEGVRESDDEEDRALPPSLGDVVGGLLSLGNKAENLPIHTEILDLRIKDDESKPSWDGTGVLDLSCPKMITTDVNKEEECIDNKQLSSQSPVYKDEEFKSPEVQIQGWSVTPEGLQTRFNELIDLENKLMDYKVALDSRAEMLATKETELQRSAANIIQKEANFELKYGEFEKRIEAMKQREAALERQGLDRMERDVHLKSREKQLSLKEELIACREKRLKLEVESMMTRLSGHSSMLVMGTSSGQSQGAVVLPPALMASSGEQMLPLMTISYSTAPVQSPTGTPLVRSSAPYPAMPRPLMLPTTQTSNSYMHPQMLTPHQSGNERPRVGYPSYPTRTPLPISSFPGVPSRVLPGARPSPRAAILPILSPSQGTGTSTSLKSASGTGLVASCLDKNSTRAEMTENIEKGFGEVPSEHEMTSEPFIKRQKMAENQTLGVSKRNKSQPLCSDVESVEQLKEIETNPSKKPASFIAKSSRTNSIIESLRDRIKVRSKSQSPPSAPPDPTFDNASLNRILPRVRSNVQ